MKYDGILENQGPGRQWRIYLDETDRALWPAAVRQSPDWHDRHYGIVGIMPSCTLPEEGLEQTWTGELDDLPKSGQDTIVSVEFDGDRILRIDPY